MRREIHIKATRPTNLKFPIVSWLIQLITNYNASHVLMYFKNDDKIFHVYFNNILFQDSTYFNNVEITHEISIEIPTFFYDKIMAECKLVQGKQTGYWTQLIGIAMVLPFRLFGLKLKNPLYKLFNLKSLTCSQLISNLLIEQLGIHEILESGIPLNTLNERDIIEILEKATKSRVNGSYIKIIK